MCITGGVCYHERVEPSARRSDSLRHNLTLEASHRSVRPTPTMNCRREQLFRKWPQAIENTRRIAEGVVQRQAGFPARPSMSRSWNTSVTAKRRYGRMKVRNRLDRRLIKRQTAVQARKHRTWNGTRPEVQSKRSRRDVAADRLQCSSERSSVSHTSIHCMTSHWSVSSPTTS